MSELPLPLPAEHIPAGTAAWRSADAARWSAAAPRRWAHPLVAMGALAVGMVWFIDTEPEGACTAAEPCATAWGSVAAAGLALLCLYWTLRQPRLALAGLGALAAATLADAGFAVSRLGTGRLVLLAAIVLAVATLIHRIVAARRQRALAEAAAGELRHRLPRPARDFKRGQFSLVVGGLLLAVSAFALWAALDVVADYDDRAAGASRVSAEVVDVDADEDDVSTLVVATLDGDRRHTLDTVFPEDYPVGSTVELVVDGDWVRLVSEPYDLMGWELLLLASAVPGVAFVANGLTGRSRARSLDGRTLPALGVLVHEGREDARTYVYAADDHTAEHPLLTFHSMYVAEPGRQPDDGAEAEAEEGAEAHADVDAQQERYDALFGGTDEEPRLREAVLLGAPFGGAEVAFLAPEPTGRNEVEFERSVTPVRPYAPGLADSPVTLAARTLKRGISKSPEQQSGRRRPRRRPVHEVAEAMRPTAAPRSWAADGGSRGVGVFLLLVQGFALAQVLDGDWTWYKVVALFGLPYFMTMVSTALNWRLTADRSGVWVAGGWRVRQVRWEQVTGVRHAHDGIEISVSGGRKEIELLPVSAGWLQRRFGKGSAAAEASEALRAMVHYPELRPTEDADARGQGAPLGPVIAGFTLVWAAAVLLV
ncbi:hypothetical protein [Streptomyces sp. NPDC047315]|uniref:hypothetical protein n=1 Tax=Streptomyces sp. NPDC047315 TaxID=3155142 RepID=UPI0033F4E499